MNNKNMIAVLGDRVLVEKEKIDCGGLKLSPVTDAEGEKNKGRVVAVGQIDRRLKRNGVKVGAVVYFKKHFIPNHVVGEEPIVFVEAGDILGVEIN
jgi:co-chaperonin GroES (HSP10)